MSETADVDRWAEGAAFIDGEFCPIAEAKLSVLDMGVTRSDCTYDVVSVWDGRFFRLDAHLHRFLHSVAQLRLDIGRTRSDLETVLHECVSRACLRNAYVSMTSTRGRPAPLQFLRVAERGYALFVVPPPQYDRGRDPRRESGPIRRELSGRQDHQNTGEVDYVDPTPGLRVWRLLARHAGLHLRDLHRRF